MPTAKFPLVALLISGVLGAGLAAMGRDCSPRSAAFSHADDDARRDATAEPEVRDTAEEEIEEEAPSGLSIGAALAPAVASRIIPDSVFFRLPVVREAESGPQGHARFIRGPPRDA